MVQTSTIQLEIRNIHPGTLFYENCKALCVSNNNKKSESFIENEDDSL